MRYRLLGKLALAVFWSGWLLGCHSDFERRPFARDPLLARKRPLEGKGGNERQLLLALDEPSPPRLPPNAYVALPPATRHGTPFPILLASTPPDLLANSVRAAPSSLKPPLATRMPRVQTSNEVQAIPVARQKNPAIYGHADNFSWLQGVLERSSSGQWLLRYRESASEDTWRGKVALEDDTRLTALQAGSVIRVEGEIVTIPSGPVIHPIYRIRLVR